jgi:molybdopterin-guanine dinucleotide biosynthesis protein A
MTADPGAGAPRVPGVAALVLAGGRSRRMGSNKALLVVDDRPVVERQVRLLETMFDEILLSTNDPEPFAFLGVRSIPDRFPDCGPLAGIHAGLRAASASRVLAVACDVPFSSATLLRRLATFDPEADVVAARIRGEIEPLPGVYSRRCADAIEARLARGECKVGALFADVRVRELSEAEAAAFDPDLASFDDLDTPADVRRAKRSTRHRG